MNIIRKIDTENIANLVHQGFGASFFVVFVGIVAGVDFVDFASVIAAGVYLEVAREGNEVGVAGVLVETDNHNRVGEVGAVVNTAAVFGAFHIEAGGTESKNVGTAVFIFFEWSVIFGEEIHKITAAAGDASEEVVTEKHKNYSANNNK